MDCRSADRALCSSQSIYVIGARKVRPKPGLPASALMLIKIRSEQHWTQAELGYYLGRDFGVGAIARSCISDWERGFVQPPLYLMSRIRTMAGLK